MSTIELTADDEARVEEFSGSLFMACLATMELANVELGVRLGLYEAMAGAGPVTAGELAKSAGIAERYAQEWLEQQATAGVVEVEDVAEPANARRFTLPNAHAHVLIDDDSEACVKPCSAVAGEGGTVLVVDERTEDTFTVPTNEMERFFYTFSTLHCLAVSLQDGGAGTGTVIRAGTLRGYAADAGFSQVEVLDVDTPSSASTA